jgi:ABC-type nitrate/sulfonate/bicarbonate transport system substrate-binding protein
MKAERWRNTCQFEQIGDSSVTAWREARRFATQDNAADILATIGSEKLEALIAAINEGDWKGYIEQSGGATALRKEQPLRTFYIPKESLSNTAKP